jgi:hypothetical protein
MSDDTKKKVGTVTFGLVTAIGVKIVIGGSLLGGGAVIAIGVAGLLYLWTKPTTKSGLSLGTPPPGGFVLPGTEQHIKDLTDPDGVNLPTQPKSAAPDPNTAEDLPK